MNFRKLITYLTMGTAAAMPLAVAQNPTIVQGNYITNVFGNSNFVLNPNALTNVANVAVSNATVTRVASTTNSLVATTEFNVTVTSANGTIAWNTRAFDNGMKGQNCEARFTYRGFQSTSVAQVRQGATVAGANVVARLALTASTDPRIASINFPCGDLSQPTYFVITDTATLSGTNEIGGIYVGLATNMANVAQAEIVSTAYRSGTQTWNAATAATFSFNNASLDTYGGFNTSTGEYTVKRAGVYEIQSSIILNTTSYGVNSRVDFGIQKNGAQVQSFIDQQQATSTRYWQIRVTATVSASVGDVLRTYLQNNVGANITTYDGGNEFNWTTIKRFPSSSELVVTPERQNVWGAAKFTGSVVKSYTFPSNQIFNDAAYGSNVALYGKAKLQATGTCGTTNNLGICIETIPPGTYKVTVDGVFDTLGNTVGYGCRFQIFDGTNDAGNQEIYNPVVNIDQNLGVLSGLFNYTSVQTNKAFSVRVSGSSNQCRNILSSTRPVNFTIEPLDQPSNSALYVQGPVQAAATGAAISASYVGYELSASSTADITTSTTELAYATLTGASIDVPAGVWLVIGEFFGYPGNASGGAGIINLGQIYNSSDSSAIISRRVHATPTTTNTSSGGGKTITTVVNLTSQKTLILRGAIQKAGGAETITSGGFFPSSQNTIRAIRLN